MAVKTFFRDRDPVEASGPPMLATEGLAAARHRTALTGTGGDRATKNIMPQSLPGVDIADTDRDSAKVRDTASPYGRMGGDRRPHCDLELTVSGFRIGQTVKLRLLVSFRAEVPWVAGRALPQRDC